MTSDIITTLATLGVIGQVLAALGVLVLLGAAAGLRGPLGLLRSLFWGYELWAAFVVSSIATGGSLFFSEVAGFVPCELCWYQRICMYPISIIAFAAALRADFRVARYLLPLPLVGAGISIYHMLVEHGVVGQSSACLVSAPGGCATRWVEKFGYVTIPGLALTAFVLLLEVLLLAAGGADESESTVLRDA